jgi:pantothenate kinase
MTPKQKAEEIFNKMYKIQDNDGIFVMYHDMAIQCALIAVTEIKKACPISPQNSEFIMLESEKIDNALEFWNEVEDELNKL